MLDVHPPHTSVHTWRDFFIHIATIVIGLLIAVGLEQTIELIHHHDQRHQLEEDLRDEAQRNLGRLQTNQKYFRVSIAWYREVLRTARVAAPSAGSVTFVLPPRATLPPIMRPLDSVWAAAKASGTVAVLPHDETETFGRVSYQAEQSMKAADVQISTLVAENAVTSRLGVTLAPGETLRLTPEERDELMRAIALRLEATRLVSLQDARWVGSSEAVLHHVRSLDEMTPYLERAVAALPQ